MGWLSQWSVTAAVRFEGEMTMRRGSDNVVVSLCRIFFLLNVDSWWRNVWKSSRLSIIIAIIYTCYQILTSIKVIAYWNDVCWVFVTKCAIFCENCIRRKAIFFVNITVSKRNVRICLIKNLAFFGIVDVFLVTLRECA